MQWNRANLITWTCTLVEVGCGVYLTQHGWPVVGGIVIGATMTSQLARVLRSWIQEG